MRLSLRVGHMLLCSAVVGVSSPACYTAGNGTAPPMTSFYFPTGLAVSKGGNVLYAVNSDFDLQWNGGTLQSYDLFRIRQDAGRLIQANLARDPHGATPPGIPFLSPWQPDCLDQPPAPSGNNFGVQLQQGCAPPVDASQYVRDSAIIGAFATELQSTADGKRLFAPVSGNATVTWADIGADDPSLTPPEGPNASFAPFSMDCGTRTDSRCDGAHAVGNDPNSQANTRNVTMPGQPFGLAQSQDGSVMAVTSEADTKTSLLTTGSQPFSDITSPSGQPTMQFVLDGVPTGGVGIVAVPHDPGSVYRCEDHADQAPCTPQAFLQTSRHTSEVDLVRYYDDNGVLSSPPSQTPAPHGSTIVRPFLVKERAYTVDTNLAGSDFRGIAIDTTERLRCQLQGAASSLQCGQIPARVFIASRTPATLVVGQVGLTSEIDGSYDPDSFRTLYPISLPAGPSHVYLAPVVVQDYQGAPTSHYELRVFVVLFDSSTIAIIDPSLPPDQVQSHIDYVVVGQGPFAMAFDPFDWSDVALQKPVPADPRQPASLGLKRYRFAYVASFTQSYAQVIDLDQLATQGETYEKVVFNLGAPSYPKGQAP